MSPVALAECLRDLLLRLCISLLVLLVLSGVFFVFFLQMQMEIWINCGRGEKLFQCYQTLWIAQSQLSHLCFIPHNNVGV